MLRPSHMRLALFASVAAMQLRVVDNTAGGRPAPSQDDAQVKAVPTLPPASVDAVDGDAALDAIGDRDRGLDTNTHTSIVGSGPDGHPVTTQHIADANEIDREAAVDAHVDAGDAHRAGRAPDPVNPEARTEEQIAADKANEQRAAE